MTYFKNKKIFRRIIAVVILLVAAFLLLSIPPSELEVPDAERSEFSRAFFWNQNARWDSLEARYKAARIAGCEQVRNALHDGMQDLAHLLATIDTRRLPSTAMDFTRLEEQFFSLAPLAATCPENVQDYCNLASRIRTSVKQQSELWDMNDRQTRETLYRLLYGSRSAVEEVMLQIPRTQNRSPLLHGFDESSSTPKATLLGVTIHSGDILVSRGGAPTSALIARGNDFPGNFSHIALAHVDSGSGRLSIIESHIERGVAISTPEEYLRDTKLRVMILRLRADLPAMMQDPLLPHHAATSMLERAVSRHIPYDFTMDYADTTNLFCSEVASTAYRMHGVQLWTGMSHISSKGLRRWLADFGVTHFTTQEPSDLEYDPQLRVVAEWRDIETLRKDHIDNAVTEAMLEGAERGDRLMYRWYMLPPARLVKAYCSILNLLGKQGKIPEGMSATAALKHEYYTERHKQIVASVLKRARTFLIKEKIEPPYWELLRMSREASAEIPE